MEEKNKKNKRKIIYRIERRKFEVILGNILKNLKRGKV